MIPAKPLPTTFHELVAAYLKGELTDDQYREAVKQIRDLPGWMRTAVPE
jgi:hypothetical protein